MKTLMPRNGQGTTLMNRMQDEMEDMFQRFFGPVAEVKGFPAQVWSPSVDVEETDKAMVVKVDLPGVDAKDVTMTIHDGSLMLRGEKKEQHEEKGKNFHRIERFSGSFSRIVPLPAEADETNVTATSSKGVITVTIPKKPGSEPKKIAIQSKE